MRRLIPRVDVCLPHGGGVGLHHREALVERESTPSTTGLEPTPLSTSSHICAVGSVH